MMRQIQATSSVAYDPKNWILNRSWMRDRAKYLLMIRYTNHARFDANNFALYYELNDLRFYFPEIFDQAWEDYFNDGLSL